MIDSDRHTLPERYLGQAIREIRRARGFTQEVLSQKSGLHPTYISDIERGRRNVGWVATASLLTALGITFEEFGEVYDRIRLTGSETEVTVAGPVRIGNAVR